MGGRSCCVIKCRRRSHDHIGRRIPNGLTFHCFPSWRTHEGELISRLTRSRRAAWVAAVGRSDISFDHIPSAMRVCSRHFHSGKPAYEMLESDPDWVPSLHLGHTEGQHRHPERPLHSAPRDGLQVRRRRKCPSKSTQKDRDQIKKRLKRLLQSAQQDRAHNQRCPAEMRPSQETETAAATGAERPSVRPWREVKSLLQSALQRQSNFSKQPAKKSDRDFREFFRDALEAALEASSRSRAFAASSGDASMSFKLPPVNQPSSSSCSCCASSSCVCCARLQRRIIELQEKLSRLRGGQEDMETSPVLYEAPVQSEQELQSPEEQEEEEKEEEEPAWTQPLSPPPHVAADADSDSSKFRPRKAPRFQKVWLKKFPFLRYSPTLDLMWCHVCRLHCKNVQQNGLIRGSRVFKFHNINKHGSSHQHRANMALHLQRPDGRLM